MDRFLRASTRVTAVITFALGVVMLALALARGGGPFAVGVIAGLAFMVLGGIRFAASSGRQA